MGQDVDGGDMVPMEPLNRNFTPVAKPASVAVIVAEKTPEPTGMVAKLRQIFSMDKSNASAIPNASTKSIKTPVFPNDRKL